jgi:putative tricarboxylic transport membrane protein
MLLLGFQQLLHPMTLLMCLFGVVIGTLTGVLPGLGPSAALAILLPVIYGRDPLTSLVMLAGIYYGAMYGGMITSVLINVPGDSAAVVTTFDGYPMAQRAGRRGHGHRRLLVLIAGSIGVIL